MRIEIILPAIILLLLILLYTKKIRNKYSQKVRYYPYRRKYLLTETEYRFYKELRVVCDKKNIIICPKVRLEDFIDVTCNEERAKYRGYIKSRHVDFVLCDNDLNILAAIELDDYSHNSESAIRIDEFKDNLFKEIGIPLNRIKVTSDYKQQIRNIEIGE